LNVISGCGLSKNPNYLKKFEHLEEKPHACINDSYNTNTSYKLTSTLESCNLISLPQILFPSTEPTITAPGQFINLFLLNLSDDGTDAGQAVRVQTGLKV
jgi:hypothetical protein